MSRTVSQIRGSVHRLGEIARSESMRFASEVDCWYSKRVPVGTRGLECSVCGYSGRFATAWALTGKRPHAHCPKCRAAERHRLQSLVVDRLYESVDFSKLAMLHVAPESMFAARFAQSCGQYVTADIDRQDVDLRLDLTDIELPDNSFDIVYASHVLEHIRSDKLALSEIARILRPGGFAILPVPIACLSTVEYPEAVASEAWHVRAPGPDYFDRYTEWFRVETFSSRDFDAKYQLYVHEDRSRFPNRFAPYRTPSPGPLHIDLVPVCYVR